MSEGRVKPNMEAEKAVIGAVLMAPDEVMPEAELMLEAEDFLCPEYRTLYRTFSNYFMDGKPIDIVTMLNECGEAYRVTLVRAAEETPTWSNWKAYAEIVRDTARKHRAFRKLLDLEKALLENESLEACQGLAVEVSGSLNVERNDRCLSAGEGFVAYYASLQEEKKYISTSFSSLDRYTYIQPGDFVVIGARPSVGKTAATLQMMLHMSRKRRVVYFSLETRLNNLFGRMVANQGGIHLGDLKRGKALDYGKILGLGERFKNELDFYAVEAAGWTVAQMKAKAVQLGAEIIFVDYMGLVKSEGLGRYEKMTNVSVDLHTLAQQTGIAVFAVSQLNREGKAGVSPVKDSREPTMENLRESGQIEQDADVVLLLHAPQGVENMEREFIIAKNKEGRVGSVPMTFQGEIQRLYGLSGREEPAG